MTVQDSNVIDIISSSRDGANVTLAISDHLDWSDSVRHQFALQDKLNAYRRFIESGEIFEQYPLANGRRIIIAVAAMHPPDVQGQDFLQKAKAIIEGAGFEFRYEVFSDGGIQ